MARSAEDVTAAELAVLEVLWRQGSATRRQIADVLYPGGSPAHYTTVQKLLERLQAKGYVAGSRGGAVRSFTAAIDRAGLISRKLQDVADKLCGGSLTPLLMNLVRARPLTSEELADLEALVRKLSGQPGGKDEPR